MGDRIHISDLFSDGKNVDQVSVDQWKSLQKISSERKLFRTCLPSPSSIAQVFLPPLLWSLFKGQGRVVKVDLFDGKEMMQDLDKII